MRRALASRSTRPSVPLPRRSTRFQLGSSCCVCSQSSNNSGDPLQSSCHNHASQWAGRHQSGLIGKWLAQHMVSFHCSNFMDGNARTSTSLLILAALDCSECCTRLYLCSYRDLGASLPYWWLSVRTWTKHCRGIVVWGE